MSITFTNNEYSPGIVVSRIGVFREEFTNTEAPLEPIYGMKSKWIWYETTNQGNYTQLNGGWEIKATNTSLYIFATTNPYPILYRSEVQEKSNPTETRSDIHREGFICGALSVTFTFLVCWAMTWAKSRNRL